MVSYKELGLVNTREMFAKAIKGGYAIPAFNFNNMEQLQAIISACVEVNSPVILQVSSGARKYANQTLLRYMAQGAVEYAKELNGGSIVCGELLGLRKRAEVENPEPSDRTPEYYSKRPCPQIIYNSALVVARNLLELAGRRSGDSEA